MTTKRPCGVDGQSSAVLDLDEDGQRPEDRRRNKDDEDLEHQDEEDRRPKVCKTSDKLKTTLPFLGKPTLNVLIRHFN
jgi:hypothetical protein